ncbi:3725_t:CDS:2 [Cetraspora pellucida]|uniref:3725_t:CDS:1 n=1 Tax=Cetraspora pellucida TaxID=1433469 RepID=A0A9N8ZQ27_9GLOM|nr:3725_t:CDS:2 [Cetraspora pellucida]
MWLNISKEEDNVKSKKNFVSSYEENNTETSISISILLSISADQISKESKPPQHQRNIKLLDPTDNDLNDSYEKIFVEDTNDELLENYSNIEKTDSETDNEVDSENE